MFNVRERISNQKERLTMFEKSIKKLQDEIRSEQLAQINFISKMPEGETKTELLKRSNKRIQEYTDAIEKLKVLPMQIKELKSKQPFTN